MQVTPSATCMDSPAFLGIKGFRETSKLTFLGFILWQGGTNQCQPFTLRAMDSSACVCTQRLAENWSAAQILKMSLLFLDHSLMRGTTYHQIYLLCW